MGTNLLQAVLVSVALPVAAICAQDVRASLDFSSTHPISPLIYGYNQDHVALDGGWNVASHRLGGNRMTTFNWEINSENAGEGSNTSWCRIAAQIVGVPWGDLDKAGEGYKVFHQKNLDRNITSIITVPIQGWVAADRLNTVVTTSPPSARWKEVVYAKGSSFSYPPDTTDDRVYLDESVNYLKTTFGGAASPGGVKYISLDNEPGLWNSTHALIQTTSVSAADYVAKVIAAAKAVKAVDPNVKIIAGEFAGINIYDFRNAPDWVALKAGYDWFIDYFLDEMKKASNLEGYNLIDLLSFHYYPQEKIDASGLYSTSGTVARTSTSTADYIRKARMSFARSLWDPTFIEQSWLTQSYLNNQPHELLGRMQRSIDTYFPGIEIMIGEFDYGNVADISHGIGTADFLGAIAAKNVKIATWWGPAAAAPNTYAEAAFKLFRNHDGSNGTYGDQSVKTTFDSPDDASVWASTDADDNDLHLILLNKNLTATQTFSIALNDGAAVTHHLKNIYAFDASGTSIQATTLNGTLTDAALNITVPNLAAYHVIIGRDGVSELTAEPCKQCRPPEMSLRNKTLTVRHLNSGERGKIGIYDLHGTPVKAIAVSGNEGEMRVDLAFLASGRYIVQFKGKTTKASSVFLR